MHAEHTGTPIEITAIPATATKSWIVQGWDYRSDGVTDRPSVWRWGYDQHCGSQLTGLMASVIRYPARKKKEDKGHPMTGS